jgi:hypothetical protein
MEDEYVNTLEGQKSASSFLIFSQRGTVKFKTDHAEDLKMWISAVTQVGLKSVIGCICIIFVLTILLLLLFLWVMVGIRIGL